MSDAQLREALAQLREEVAKARFADAQSAQRLQHLVDDIEQAAVEERAPAEHQSLRDALNGSVGQFELEHPRIAGLLNRIAAALSAMGI